MKNKILFMNVKINRERDDQLKTKKASLTKIPLSTTVHTRSAEDRLYKQVYTVAYIYTYHIRRFDYRYME